MRKKLLAVLSIVAALLGVGLGIARAEGGDDFETYAEKSGVGPGFERGMAGLGYTASGMGEANGSPYQVGSQSLASGPSFSFFPDQEMSCSLEKDGLVIGCGQAIEPEVKSAPDGTIFVTAQDGTPGGVMAWRRDPGTFSYTQLDKPDGAPVVGNASGTTGGGGDNELAISAPDANGNYRVYVSSLMSLVTNGVAVSTNRGDSWLFNPVASNFAGVDRQWLAASGEKTVYLAYHEMYLNSILLVRSDDGGLTWGPPQEMFDLDNMQHATSKIGSGNWQSNLVALPGGGVALSYIRGGTPQQRGLAPCVAVTCPAAPMDQVWVATTDASGNNPQDHFVGSLPQGTGVLFGSIAVDRAGNLYVVQSNGHQVYLSHSIDRGLTWSPLVDVTAQAAPGTTDSSLFPYVVAGSAGKVAIAWLGAGGTNDDNADWTTQFAETTDGLAASPTFTVMQASNHVVHHGAVCTGGLGCNAADPTGAGGRELAEVLQMGITKDGRVLISYPDNSDGSHFSGWTWVVEQNAGPGLYDDVTPTPGTPPTAGHSVANFTATGSLPLYFTNASDGLPISPASGYQFDGATIAGALASLPGSKGHVGVIGYAANSTPGTATSVVFQTAPLASDLTVGGSLDFNLWVQNELGANGATELDYNLFDVAPDGGTTGIIGRSVQNGDEVTGGDTAIERSYSYPITGGYVLPAGHTLRIEMSFPYLVSSSTRLYYGDATYPSRITLGVGTGS
ncbi:MAG: hypothetical protein QOG03_1054 [Actinomycetota bacterium]|nr:hypothetical protein [Actinomycetota bacterium]